MPRPQPTLEFRRLAFPSDQLTIQAIRAVYPESFAQEEPAFFAAQFTGHRHDVSTLLWMERALAHKAFAATLGQPDPHPQAEWSRREMIRMLTEAYKSFGLSTGRKHTEQLVRVIEEAATAQAREHQGKGHG